MNELQRLIRGRMSELSLSYRQAAAKSGKLVSHGTLNSIVTGRHSWKIDDRTMRGIAVALEVDLAVVEAAVGRAARMAETEFVLPDRASRLSMQERRAVLSMIDALLSAADGGHERPDEATRGLSVDASPDAGLDGQH